LIFWGILAPLVKAETAKLGCDSSCNYCCIDAQGQSKCVENILNCRFKTDQDSNHMLILTVAIISMLIGRLEARKAT